MHARAPLVDDIRRTPIAAIERRIERACRGKSAATQQQSNVELARLLRSHVEAEAWLTANYEMGPRSVGQGQPLRLWAEVVCQDNDGLFIPAFDERRRGGLSNPSARQFLHSAQHHAVVARDLDLAGSRYALIQFPVLGQTRSVRVTFYEGELLSFEEVECRVQLIYRLWGEIYEERVEDERRTGTGKPNPFGF
jgi:hypothetical protein